MQREWGESLAPWSTLRCYQLKGPCLSYLCPSHFLGTPGETLSTQCHRAHFPVSTSKEHPCLSPGCHAGETSPNTASSGESGGTGPSRAAQPGQRGPRAAPLSYTRGAGGYTLSPHLCRPLLRQAHRKGHFEGEDMILTVQGHP